MTFYSRNNLDLAVSMAERGWHIFPCHSVIDGGCSCLRACKSPAKHPLTPNGLNDSTNDPAYVRLIWTDTGWANIGLRTGPESGLWVLDLDGEAGIQALKDLEAKHGSLPRTPMVKTGSGGRHIFFALPPDTEIKSTAKIGGQSIDVRGVGGYVIAAGSLHIEGSYDWIISPDEAPLAHAPAWLLELVTTRQPKPATEKRPAAVSNGDRSQDQEFDVFHVSQALDLEADEGAKEGGRNNRACQLIGSHLGRGEDPSTVETKALAWATRCDPPMDADEVKGIVRRFARKDAEKSDVEFEPVAESKPWPVLDEAALYGLPGEIVRIIEPSTEADRVAILSQLLTYFGNVIGRSPYFEVEATRHHTNLFAVLVGQTAKGRKGTSEGWVRRLFQDADPQWSASRVQNGLSSGEGLIWAVRDPIEKTEPIKDKSKSGLVTGYQQVVSDPGIEDKRLLVRESEFASVLKVIRREGNTLTTTVRDAWDSGDLRAMTKNSPGKATGGHISIAGHITQEELRRCMDDVEGFNGFANRFLWLCVQRSKLLAEGGLPVDLSAVVGKLKVAVEFAKMTDLMTREIEARRLWFRIYEELATPHAGLFGAITSRAEAQVLRLSMLYALLDVSAVIRPEHLNAAMALWRYAEDSARYIFGDSTGDNLADKVLAIIRNESVTTKEIHDRTNRHHKASDLNRVLTKLSNLKLIRSEKIATGGRPAERWSTV